MKKSHLGPTVSISGHACRIYIVVGYPGTERHASPDHPQAHMPLNVKTSTNVTTNVITPFKCYNFSPINAKTSIYSRDSKFENCRRVFMAHQDYFANFKQSRILCWAKSGLCYRSSQMHLYAMFPIFS